MPRGKRAFLIPSRTIDVRVPEELLDAVDARLYDPILGKAAYGSRNALIIRLLAEWIASTPLNPKTAEALEKTKPSLEQMLATMSRG